MTNVALRGKPDAGNPHRKTRTLHGTILALLAVAATISAQADEPYQFIVSGYPAANESYAAPSAATSLETGTLSTPAAAQGLEARYRTWLVSEGTGLLSTPFKGFMLILR